MCRRPVWLIARALGFSSLSRHSSGAGASTPVRLIARAKRHPPGVPFAKSILVLVVLFVVVLAVRRIGRAVLLAVLAVLIGFVFLVLIVLIIILSHNFVSS